MNVMEKQVFVARERELGQLDGCLNRALAGQGQVCFVTGEAGSGKTTLVTEFAHRAQDAHADLLVTIGNCSAQTGIGDPYLPFREVLGLLTGDVEAKRVSCSTWGWIVACLEHFIGFCHCIGQGLRRLVLQTQFLNLMSSFEQSAVVQLEFFCRKRSDLRGFGRDLAWKVVDVPVVAMGGVTTGRDVVEMLLVGAAAVGIGSAVHYRGMEVFREVCEGLRDYMERHGYGNLGAFRGRTT